MNALSPPNKMRKIYLLFVWVLISCNQKNGGNTGRLSSSSNLGEFTAEGKRDFDARNNRIINGEIAGAEAIKSLAAGQAKLARKQQELWARVDSLEERINNLESDMKDVKKDIEKIFSRLTNIEDKLPVIMSRLATSEQRIAQLEQLSQSLSEALSVLTGEVKILEKTIPKSEEDLARYEEELRKFMVAFAKKPFDNNCKKACEAVADVLGKNVTDLSYPQMVSYGHALTALSSDLQSTVITYRHSYTEGLQKLEAQNIISSSRRQALAAQWLNVTEPEVAIIKAPLVAFIEKLSGQIGIAFTEIKNKQAEIEALSKQNSSDIKNVHNTLMSNMDQLETNLAQEMMKLYTFGTPNPAVISEQVISLSSAATNFSNVISLDKAGPDYLNQLGEATISGAARHWRDFSFSLNDDQIVGKKLGQYLKKVESEFYNYRQSDAFTSHHNVYRNQIRNHFKAINKANPKSNILGNHYHTFRNMILNDFKFANYSHKKPLYVENNCFANKGADMANIMGVVEPLDFVRALAIKQLISSVLMDMDHTWYKSGKFLMTQAMVAGFKSLMFVPKLSPLLNELEQAIHAWGAGIYKAPGDSELKKHSPGEMQKRQDDLMACSQYMVSWASSWLKTLPGAPLVHAPLDNNNHTNGLSKSIQQVIHTISDKQVLSAWGELSEQMTEPDSPFLDAKEKQAFARIMENQSLDKHSSDALIIEGAYQRLAGMIVKYAEAKHRLDFTTRSILSGIAALHHSILSPELKNPLNPEQTLADLFETTYLPEVARLESTLLMDCQREDCGDFNYENTTLTGGKIKEIIDYRPTRLDQLEETSAGVVSALSLLVADHKRFDLSNKILNLKKQLLPANHPGFIPDRSTPMVQKIIHTWSRETYKSDYFVTNGYANNPAACSTQNIKYGEGAYTDISTDGCSVNFRNIPTSSSGENRAQHVSQAQITITGSCDYLLVRAECYLALHPCSPKITDLKENQPDEKMKYIASALAKRSWSGGSLIVPDVYNLSDGISKSCPTDYPDVRAIEKSLLNPSGFLFKNRVVRTWKKNTDGQFIPDMVDKVQNAFADLYVLSSPHIWFGKKYAKGDKISSLTAFAGDTNLVSTSMTFIPINVGSSTDGNAPFRLYFPPYKPGQKLAGHFKYEVELVSPLVLDFSPESGLKTIPFIDAQVSFDLKARKVSSKSGWISGHEAGFLAADFNQNGVIDNGRELFGHATEGPTGGRFPNGYHALESFDQNRDRKITKEDQLWDSLIVWFDFNQDGISQKNELKGLIDLGVTGISVAYEDVPAEERFNGGNLVRYQSRFYGPSQCGSAGCPSYDIYFDTAYSVGSAGQP